jgi:hypothetical protein
MLVCPPPAGEFLVMEKQYHHELFACLLACLRQGEFLVLKNSATWELEGTILVGDTPC